MNYKRCSKIICAITAQACSINMAEECSRSLFGVLWEKITLFITSILKSMVILAIRLVLIGVIRSQIAPFFALNRIFVP